MFPMEKGGHCLSHNQETGKIPYTELDTPRVQFQKKRQRSGFGAQTFNNFSALDRAGAAAGKVDGKNIQTTPRQLAVGSRRFYLQPVSQA